MKLLFYCTKAKPYLVKENDFNGGESKYKCIFQKGTENAILNGYIVAEAESGSVEEIYYKDGTMEQAEYGILGFRTKSLTEETLLQRSCLSRKQLDNYLAGSKGYAIHLKNVKPFYEPKHLSECYKKYCWQGFEFLGTHLDPLEKAPQNMCYCCDKDEKNSFILVSIQPEWLCKILNGEKTIEIRTKILKTIDYIRLKSRRIK